ncbi:Sel1 repeat protein [Bernardetia litoralis DSM 6794]|uniref:Sel1 repeat protein n=1 Tax=Bernardetia litoralis (strain ATCC 23117 / DSM 6794 / NBRC 15988 / NCIMB 1366 / Fx l1 / Sio-4) TaxID=880071 RepID=I4AN95_BERLS|nr:sel1 repeat family protein [Bernardetia litoralis]AFM05430.1 Sel1 repeat protein [Bernardetia litoralis DSM 6794]
MTILKKIKNPFLFFFSVYFLSFLMISCGSAPQTISKDSYKVYKKQAKSGNSTAMLKIANAFKGDMFTSNELRDYENAIKWYSQAMAASSTQKIPAARELFEIYMTGSKDVPRNIDAAKKWLQIVADSMDLHIYYQDNTDLYLMDIFDVYKKATKAEASAESQFLLGRYFLEFEIDYNTGVRFLDKAANTDSARYSQDVNYIKSKWQFFRNRRSDFTNNVAFEAQKDKAHQVMKRLSNEGSELAKLEYTNYIVHNAKNPQDVKEETEKLLRNFVIPKFANKEQQLKATYLVALTQEGKDHIIELRKLYTLKSQNFSMEQFPYMDNAINEYKEIANQLETLTGLGKLTAEHSTFSDIPLELPNYYQHYNGDIRPLVALKNAITTDENIELLTSENVEKYKQTLLEQVDDIFAKANTPSELYSFKNALKKDTFFKPLAKPYLDSLIQQQINKKGLIQEDLVYEYEKERLENTTFYNLGEGRKFVESISKRNDLDPEPVAKSRWARKPTKQEPRKNALLKRAKIKVLEDIYGSSPTIKQIEELNKTIPRYSWLAPQGREWAVGLKGNSDSWFTGIVEVNKTRTQYFYEVKRFGDSDRFLMEIKSIKNNKSNNAYSTNIEVEKILKKGSESGDVEGYNVTIFGAKYQTYGWKQSKTDFFRVVCKPSDGKLENAICTGYMAINRDKSHSDDFVRKHNISSNSQKDSIRAVVRYFILEMHKNLGIR